MWLPGLLGFAGCASTDPTEDLQESQRLVAERSGIPVDWRGPWNPDAVLPLPGQKLSANDVARLALHNHAGLRASVESITQARADYVQAHLLPNPILNFNLGFPIDGGSTNPAMATLLQPLAALWQRPAEIDAAGSRLRAVLLNLSNAALELVAEARLAHARLVYAERDLALEIRARELATQSLALVEQRLTEGEATRLDRNRIALECLDAEMRVTDATARRDRAHRSLLEICGVADEDAMPSTDDASCALPAGLDQLAENDVVQMTQRQRLDLAAARELMSGAMSEARLAELRRIPALSIGAGYQRNFSGLEAIGPSLGLEIPIFDTGHARVAKADSLARAATAEIERLRQAAIAETRRAFVRLRGASRNVARLRGSVLALAVDNRELAEHSLDAGVVDRSEVLEFALREVRARLLVNKVELESIEWYLELERAVGGRIAMSKEAG